MTRFLLAALLLFLLVAWAGPATALATDPTEPLIFTASACSAGALVTPATPPSVPSLEVFESVTPARMSLCVACKEFVPTCKSPGQDTGKACGDGSTPGTCTCKRCNGDFGCYP